MAAGSLPTPMLASTAEPPVVQRGLVYEPKYDGMRVIVRLQNDLGSRFTVAQRP